MDAMCWKLPSDEPRIVSQTVHVGRTWPVQEHIYPIDIRRVHDNTEHDACQIHDRTLLQCLHVRLVSVSHFSHFGYTYSLFHSRSSFTRKFLAWCYPLGAVHPPPTLPATLWY